MSCNDTSKDKVCGSKRDNKSVGGYASTYKGWTGWYNYITLCPAWFQLDDLETKMLFVEDELQKGNPKYAQEAQWQKSQGQFFLHEMMHLDVIGNPHSKIPFLVFPLIVLIVLHPPPVVLLRYRLHPVLSSVSLSRRPTSANWCHVLS